jgi:hypothetical protein
MSRVGGGKDIVRPVSVNHVFRLDSLRSHATLFFWWPSFTSKSLTRARSFLPPGEAQVPEPKQPLAVHGVSAMHPCSTISASHHAISGGNTHVDESNLNMGYFKRQLQGIYHTSKDDNHPQELLRGYSLVGFLLKSLRPISACVSRRRGDEARAACLEPHARTPGLSRGCRSMLNGEF